MENKIATIQKNVRFAAEDLQRLISLYKQSKIKGGFGAFLASRIIGKSELKGKGWQSLPEQKGDSKKTMEFHFRCTSNQHTTITNFFNQSNSKNLADFFVNAVEKGKVITVKNRVLPGDQMRDLNQIGHNVNQIARKTNSLRTGDYNDSILREIREELNKISSELHKLITP